MNRAGEFLRCRLCTKSMFTLVVAFSLLNACKTTTIVDEYRITATSISPHEAIVILGRRHQLNRNTEYDFIHCVEKFLTAPPASLQVIPERTFVDALYPWFEVSTAPMDIANLDNLLQDPTIATKFREFHIRYFIWIEGSTEMTNSDGSVSCAIGPGGGGCIGFKTWDDEANYEASIWDLKESNLSGKINTETSGTSYVPALIIPIPLLARVKATACHALSNQLLSFISGNDS